MWDGVLSIFPNLVGVAIVTPSSLVCTRNDPLASGGWIILILAGFLSLSMVRISICLFVVVACSRSTTVNLIDSIRRCKL